MPALHCWVTAMLQSTANRLFFPLLRPDVSAFFLSTGEKRMVYLIIFINWQQNCNNHHVSLVYMRPASCTLQDAPERLHNSRHGTRPNCGIKTYVRNLKPRSKLQVLRVVATGSFHVFHLCAKPPYGSSTSAAFTFSD